MARELLKLFSRQVAKEGGDDVILNRIAAGDTIKEIADDYNVSRTFMYTWRKQSPERIAAWDQAMEDSADAAVDKAQEIMTHESEAILPGEARDRKDRADFFLKLAKLRNARKYGAQKSNDVNINFNTGNLHLTALEESGSMRLADGSANTALPTAEEAEVLEEVVYAELDSQGEGEDREPVDAVPEESEAEAGGAAGVQEAEVVDEDEGPEPGWEDALNELM